ncbi:MAG: hypothetical protein JXB15_08840 [Anaerolineales bacterium]|nr:hypothetical protein [Anaerolineales bacterium]
MTMTPTSSSSFYAPVDDAQRDAFLEGYLQFLHLRDGELDPQTGALANRESSLQAMNSSPIRYRGRLSQDDFVRLYANFDSSAPQLTPELLVLLTFCKMNAGEAYGVRVVKAIHQRRHQDDSPLNRAILFAQEEEEYHTRILVGATHHFDIQAEGAYLPKLLLKVLIHSIAYAPQPLFHPILYGAEVAGVYLFNWTLNRLGDFFQDQPELRVALEQRLIEILIDEMGHVAFNRLAMGESGRRLGQILASQTVRGFPFITPEVVALGFDRAVQRQFNRFDLSQLPEEVRQRGFFA